MNQGEQRKSELLVMGRINNARREKKKGISRCADLQGFGAMSGPFHLWWERRGRALPQAVGPPVCGTVVCS